MLAIFLSPNNIEKAVGILTCSCIGESGSILHICSVFLLPFISKVLHMEYICLSVPVPQEKNGEGRNKKEKSQRNQ